MTIYGLKVLVVDDEIAIQRFLRVALNGQGFIVSEANTGQAALQAITLNRPDLVILDLGLPDMDGIEVTRRTREWSKVPIIILSVREQEDDKIAALDAGADDYLTKPFGMGELLARIRTVLRRQSTVSSEPVITIGGLVVDLANRLVTMNGAEVQLTPTEYDILRLLVTNAGKVLTNRQLLKQVWGDGYDDLHILRVNVSNLRHKLEPDPSRPTYIHTEPGVGYRLKSLL
ncbi:MAG TPA: DNA-binding response regulator [Anaerolineaceae bacterium]|nr:DNA-binding response regulator [Anaerolineaceae bacterium]